MMDKPRGNRRGGGHNLHTAEWAVPHRPFGPFESNPLPVSARVIIVGSGYNW